MSETTSVKRNRINRTFLEWVMGRCHIEDVPDACWMWTRRLDGGYPVGEYLGQRFVIRRKLLQEMGVGLGTSRVATARPGCDDRCVRPEHLGFTSRSAMLAGRVFTMKHRANIAKVHRMRIDAKLTLEDALDIRYSAETLDECARRLGISESLAGQIRRGEKWKEYSSPFAGLFTGLVASNDTNRRAA